jgi:hypothetical protein
MDENKVEWGKEKKSISFTIYMNWVGDALNPQNFSIENNNLLDWAIKWMG